jgi:DNA-binding response OmpR family regulator
MATSQSGTHILIIDDDEKIRLLLRRCLEPEGFQVSEAATRDEALNCLSGQPVGLVTLDLNLGKDDGLVLAREIRSRSEVPIIMVTGKGDTIDRVVGLELGADDYITKPFHVRELLARVRTVLRRSEKAENAEDRADSSGNKRYKFDGWTADFDKLEVVNPDGQQCELTTTELNLLQVFVTRANRVLSRDHLMDILKGSEWTANDRSIDNQIARLRKKIEQDPANPLYLKTVRGAGYKFTASVKTV